MRAQQPSANVSLNAPEAGAHWTPALHVGN